MDKSSTQRIQDYCICQVTQQKPPFIVEMTIEIVDVPIKHGDFPVRYVTLDMICLVVQFHHLEK